MHEWFNNYSLPLKIEKLDKNVNLDEYVNLLKLTIHSNEDDILQNKVEQIETDYLTKLQILEVECNNINIEDYNKKNSLEILQKELDIIKLLTKYSLQNNVLEFNFFIASLNFLFHLSEILRIRINQKEIIHDNKIINNSISRCSYKFCNYKDTCVYNYNTKNKSKCYQDHYVHCMVSADLLVLIEYITTKFENQQEITPNKEILKSINTLSFVINHMESELRAKCMYIDESDWEKYHFVKL
jgi:hypothetical protein